MATAPLRTKQFKIGNRQLEVRAAPIGNDWKVRVFENSKIANKVVYSVSHVTLYDAKGLDLIGDLMNLAIADFKAWTKWLATQPKKPTKKARSN